MRRKNPRVDYRPSSRIAKRAIFKAALIILPYAVFTTPAISQQQQAPSPPQRCFLTIRGACWQGITMDSFTQNNMPDIMKSGFNKLLDVLEHLEDTVTIPFYTEYLKKGVEYNINADKKINDLQTRAINIAGSGNENEMEAFLCSQQGKSPGCL